VNTEAFRELTRKLALELMFAEAGKDTGLLPLNSLLSQIEELCQADAPPAIQEAVTRGRQAVDKIFESNALFNEPSLSWLREWNAWIESALEALLRGQPVPNLPTRWSGAPAQSAASGTGASAFAGPAPAAAASEEIPLVLNIESDGELLREFVAESQEHLQNIELGVLVLEDNPTDAGTLNSIFRAFHTFKGGSGFLKLTPVNRLAHELESLLDLARQQKLLITSDIINLILEGGDTLQQFIAEIQTALAAGHATPIVIPIASLIVRVRAVVSSPEAPVLPVSPAPAPVGRDTAPAVPLVPAPPSSALAAPAAATGKSSPAKTSGDAGIVKVDTYKLDSLLDLVGELVIAQSMVSQDDSLKSLNSPWLNRNLAQVSGITRELQKISMSMRMVPIRPTFQKMQRLVRDLAAKQAKQVELKMSGAETELDRSITEEINDPLVHMIRNSVDHGIEKPEARTAKGKSPHGTVTLRACHEGGNIVVEVADDGAGLNKEKLLAKAIEKGIVRPDEQLSEQEIFDLIFAPGFSTAEKVTDISGRGVGMDVVRRNVGKLRGKVGITSTPGQGTTFTISLPLTLAIIDGFIVGVGKERFILPTYCVRESFRPTPDMLASVHERCEMVNLRGRLSPLLRLYKFFGVEATATDPTQGIVLLVEHDNKRRALLVDRLLGKQEVVIKSLGDLFKQSPAIAGAAILGDGRVGLILDVSALVKLKAPPLAQAA
jgi:two-component system chemotaxis sensor kinase CheA